jgi:DNA-binding CsgD family transcriptional regulator
MSTPQISSPSSPSAERGLTARELEILELLAHGARTSLIAERLAISENTVKSHLTSIYKKTGSRNRVQAARHYLELLDEPLTAGHSSAAAIATLDDRSLERRLDALQARLADLLTAADEVEQLRQAIAARDAGRPLLQRRGPATERPYSSIQRPESASVNSSSLASSPGATASAGWAG